MNKSQLIERIAKEEGITIKNAANVVNVVFDSMADSLAKGDRVEIRGFGSFKVKSYNSYQGRRRDNSGQRKETSLFQSWKRDEGAR
jgi:integration host factor subunit beta